MFPRKVACVDHAAVHRSSGTNERTVGLKKEKEIGCPAVCCTRSIAERAHDRVNKREGLTTVSGDVCASLTLTSFDANADAYTSREASVQESHACLLATHARARVCP